MKDLIGPMLIFLHKRVHYNHMSNSLQNKHLNSALLQQYLRDSVENESETV